MEKMSKREHTVIKPEPIRALKMGIKHSTSHPNLSTQTSRTSQLPSPINSSKHIGPKASKSPIGSQRRDSDVINPSISKRKGGKDQAPLDLSNKSKSESNSPDLFKKVPGRNNIIT